MRKARVWSLGQEDSPGKKWQPAAVFFPGKSPGQRSLAGYTVHGVPKESDMTQQLNNNNTNAETSSELRAVKSHAQVHAVGKWHHRDPHTWSAEATLLTLTPGTEGKPCPALDPLAAKPSWSYSCTESLLLWWSCSGSRRRYPPKGWLWSSRRAEKEDEILVKTSHFIIPLWCIFWSSYGWLEKIFKHAVSL